MHDKQKSTGLIRWMFIIILIVGFAISITAGLITLEIVPTSNESFSYPIEKITVDSKNANITYNNGIKTKTILLPRSEISIYPAKENINILGETVYKNYQGKLLFIKYDLYLTSEETEKIPPIEQTTQKPGGPPPMIWPMPRL